MDEITNRVASSGLITLDLEEYYDHAPSLGFDMAPALFEGLLLREKDYRAYLKAVDLTPYQGANVAVYCSTDAIIPTWAFMLAVLALQPIAKFVVAGTVADLDNALFQNALAKIDFSQYQDAKVVVKGCSKHPVPTYAYGEVTRQLAPVAASIMFGEPCSTVPLYKRPKAQ